MSEKQIKKLDKPITPFVVKTLTKRLNKIIAAGEILDQLSDEELHEVRIRCKKVRYAIEFFTPLFDAEEMKNFTATFKGLQRQLGIINDVAVMPGLLNRILEGVEDPEARAFADAMAALRVSQQDDAKAKLPQCWADLAAIDMPWAPKPEAEAAAPTA